MSVHFGHKVTAAEIIEYARQQGKSPLRFFVDLTDTTTRKCYGIQYVDQPEPARFMGAWGARTVRFTEPLVVQRGHREVTYPASKEKPIVATEHLQFSEGK